MADQRPRYGPALATLGAIVLAVSVFLPWYGLSFTANGVAFAQQAGDQAASQYGNAALQSYMGMLHADLSGLVGHQFAAVSAHQVLHDLNVVLLLAAGFALLIGLVALAGGSSGSFEVNRGALALIGAVATVCVLYRIVHPPAVEGNLFAISLREGAWLALLGSLAILGGALWPRRLDSPATSWDEVEGTLSSLSGWTPET
ncbi:MAG TPA: hypothetical protein VKG38_12150 [Solirubrobacteraceae bacterium]|nr:hypothetical protein [Solirubrobacteraceae bacterium]